MSTATHAHEGHDHNAAHDHHGPIMVFHAIMPALVCFVAIASEILSNQPGPPLWP